jgi:hypothetical protein
MVYRLTIILLFLLGGSGLNAQTIDSLLQKFDLSDSLKYLSVDSLDRQALYTLDSIQIAAGNSFDNLKSSYDSINSAAIKEISTIQSRLDSVKNLNLPTTRLTARLDSLIQWKDAKLDSIRAKVDALKGKVEEKIESLALTDELKDKTNELTAMVDKLDVSLPDAEFPELDFGELNFGDIKNPLSHTTLPELKDLNLSTDLNELTDPIQEGIADVVPENINDLPSTIEDEASKIVQLDDVQKQMGEVDDLKVMAGQLNDAEAVKEKLQEEIQQQAVDHFAGKEQQLEKAMETLAKYKKKYASVQSLEDLPKKRPNPMRDKPFVERLVPGIAIQIHRKDIWLVDFNPYLGYRLNERLTTGLGWNQRLGYNFEENEFQSELRIFGPRSYGEFNVAKGFSARLELEYMKTTVPTQFSSGHTDEQGMEWVFSSMIGLKKNYTFIKRVKGTVMLLYNIYDPHHRSPYGDKLNMRMGFEFPLKSKTKTKS